MDKVIVPKVSVVMPIYNAEKYVVEAIESILTQTFTDFEFIIINDGSTDRSEEIILTFNDSKIKYLKNTHNLGLVETLNFGIKIALGIYIVRMDADDISFPERLSKQVAFMDQNPNIGVMGSAYEIFGDMTKTYSPPTDPMLAYTHLSFNSAIGHPTSIIRKSVLDKNNIQYESRFEYAADYAFWIRISQVSNIISTEEPLLRYRWHTSNMSNSDPSVNRAKSEARVLWYELHLKRPISDLEKKYLARQQIDWPAQMAGQTLLAQTIESNLRQIDSNYFSKLNITEWEVISIKNFGIKGLLYCLIQYSFRKKSHATFIGLLYTFIQSKLNK